MTVPKPPAILISSCDKYSDLWLPCVNLLKKHWPDRPYKLYLGTDFKTFDDKSVISLPVGAGLPWAPSFRRQLEALDEDTVIFFVSDFFLRRRVNTSLLEQCNRLFHELDAHCVRLSKPGGAIVPLFETSIVGAIPLGSPYRLSCNPAIWKKSTLLDLLRDDESIWQFEVNGSLRTNRYPTGFYSAWRNVLFFGQNVVERGKWLPWEAAAFGAMNIGCDFSARDTMSPKEAAAWILAKTTSVGLLALPWQLHWRLRKLLNRRGHEKALHGRNLAP